MLKMVTGLVARLGLSLPLRLLVFGGMCWTVWRWIASGSATGMVAWAQGLQHPLGIAAVTTAVTVGIVMVVIGVISAFVFADDNKWGLSGMLRRAPFVLWCSITDDNKSAHLWMLVLWPLIVVTDFVVSLCLAVAILVVGTIELLSLKMWG